MGKMPVESIKTPTVREMARLVKSLPDNLRIYLAGVADGATLMKQEGEKPKKVS